MRKENLFLKKIKKKFVVLSGKGGVGKTTTCVNLAASLAATQRRVLLVDKPGSTQTYFWIGNRHRDAADARPAIADYDLVNLILRRKNILKHWEAAIWVRNLFDEDIREPSPVPGAIPHDYPMEGRSIFGEVRFYF